MARQTSVGQSVFDRIAMGWQSRSNYRISAMLSCAGRLRRTSNTHLPTGEATGECPSRDHVRVRIGRCEWKVQTVSNDHILWPLVPESSTLKSFAD